MWQLGVLVRAWVAVAGLAVWAFSRPAPLPAVEAAVAASPVARPATHLLGRPIAVRRVPGRSPADALLALPPERRFTAWRLSCPGLPDRGGALDAAALARDGPAVLRVPDVPPRACRLGLSSTASVRPVPLTAGDRLRCVWGAQLRCTPAPDVARLGGAARPSSAD